MFAVQIWEWYHSSHLLLNKETDKHILQKNWKNSFILTLQPLYYIPNWQADCISELCFYRTCTTNVLTKNRHISSFPFITRLFQHFL